LYKVGKNIIIKIYSNDYLNINSFIFEGRNMKADEVKKQLKDAGITEIKFIQTL